MSLVADVFIDMNTGDLDTTVLSPTILANGTIGTYATPWVCAPTTPTGFTIDAHAAARTLYDEVVVGATHYPTSHTSRPMRLLHTATNGTTVQISFAAGKTKVTVAGFLTLGPSVAGFTVFDYISVFSALGDFAVLQLENGGSAPNYTVNIESNPSGVTTHSATAVVVSGATYWVSLHLDFTAGTCTLKMYDSSKALVVNLSSTMQAGSELGWIKFGNNEVGTDAGTASYFENILVDYTSAVDPLGPGGGDLGVSIGEPTVGSSVF